MPLREFVVLDPRLSGNDTWGVQRGEAHSPGAGLCIRNSLESLFHKEGMSVGCLCATYSGRAEGLCPSAKKRSIANTNDKALDCARLFIDTSIGMMIGRTH